MRTTSFNDSTDAKSRVRAIRRIGFEFWLPDGGTGPSRSALPTFQ